MGNFVQLNFKVSSIPKPMNSDVNEAKKLASQSISQVEANSSSDKRSDGSLDLIATKVIWAQIFTGCLSSLIWAFVDKYAWGSALSGALVVTLPSIMMAYGLRLLRQPNKSTPFSLGRWIFWELMKLTLSIALMVITVRFVQNLHWLAYMTSLVLTLQMYWLAPLVLRKRF